MRNLQNRVFRQAPIISRPEYQQSRRIEDECEIGESDAKGYKRVIIYIQRGLGSCREDVSRVLRSISRAQITFHFVYEVRLLAWGWEDGVLRFDSRYRRGDWLPKVGPWTSALCDLAGDEPGADTTEIPDLFNSDPVFLGARTLVKTDLLVFFCGGDSLRLLSPVTQFTARDALKHGVCVFLGKEPVRIEYGFVVDESGIAAPRPAGEPGRSL